jgi:hypothetical protein
VEGMGRKVASASVNTAEPPGCSSSSSSSSSNININININDNINIDINDNNIYNTNDHHNPIIIMVIVLMTIVIIVNYQGTDFSELLTDVLDVWGAFKFNRQKEINNK